jgi:hypothetical protein
MPIWQQRSVLPTPEGIKPGKNKLKAIQTAKAPADVKNDQIIRGGSVTSSGHK